MEVLGALTFGALAGLVSVELGAEFFVALNTALNLATLMYMSRRVHRKVENVNRKVEHIDKVADVLDTREPGGQRAYDPPECERCTP